MVPYSVVCSNSADSGYNRHEIGNQPAADREESCARKRQRRPSRQNITFEEAGNDLHGNRIQTVGGTTSPGYLVPFITVTALFFIFGFITNLNMALVPHLRSIFDLPYAWAMLAESAFFLAYFVFSSPTSKLIETIGYKRTMVVSLFIQVVGCLLFVPAAKMVSFPLFLTAVFVVGAGVTALQTSANPYVAILGPEDSASVRLTLAQAFNSLGGTIAPLVAGAYILTDPTKLSKAAIADTVRGPYIVIAAGLLILGLAVPSPACPISREKQVPAGQSRRSGSAASGHTGTRSWAPLESSFMWASKSAWRPSPSTTSRPRA